MDVQHVQKGQTDYIYKRPEFWSFYKVRFRVVCNGYCEYSDIASFSMRKLMTKAGAKNIKLEHHSHRGHWDKYHPRNLLAKDSDYCSKTNKSFKKNEKDWIIFRKK